MRQSVSVREISQKARKISYVALLDNRAYDFRDKMTNYRVAQSQNPPTPYRLIVSAAGLTIASRHRACPALHIPLADIEPLAVAMLMARRKINEDSAIRRKGE